MPSWKRVIVSGSDASLNSVYSKTFVSASSADITTSFTASGLNYPTQDNGEFSFIQTDGNGNLSLQYVDTMYEVIVNGELTQIQKGTPVYVSGSQGADSIVYRADASNPLKMPVTYIAADNIDSGASGRGILLGLITGVNTTGYAPGTEVYVAAGGGWTSTRPTGSNIAQLLGIVTKEGNGGQGVVLNPGPFNVPNLLSGQIFWGDSTGNPIKKSLAHILSGSNYIYSGSFSGSFQGDGSQLTNLYTIPTFAIKSTFTNTTSSLVTHNLGTENILVSVYDNLKNYIIPDNVQIIDSDSLRVSFSTPTTGYIVLTNGGHILSGSLDWSNVINKPSGLISSSAQISYTNISNIPSGIVSSSAQIIYNQISSIPSGIVSGSSQINFASISNKPTLVSGSSQIIYNQISNIPSGIISSSNQLSNQTIPGNLIITGKLTAEEFHTEFVSASIIYKSGSTQFGNSLDDIHNFSGSLAVNTNNLFVSGGNVGIGTTSPNAVFEIGGLIPDVTKTVFRSSLGVLPTNYYNDITAVYSGLSAEANKLQINYANGYTSGTGIVLQGNGNVGIGTTSPSNKLDVVGAVSASTYYGNGSNLTGVVKTLSVLQQDVVLGSDTNIFSVTSGSLPADKNNILIYRNGQFISKKYISTHSSSQITLTFTATSGDEMSVVWFTKT